MSFIYKITNLINGNFYIGKTSKTLDKRFKQHLYSSKTPKTYLHKAISKYGIDSFSIELIEEVPNHILNEREIYWISSLSPKYNMTNGGDGGDTSKSPNYIKHIQNYIPHGIPSYGMKGKQQSDHWKETIKESNSCKIMCYGVIYNSISEAESALPGISIRKRLDSERHPEFIRLQPKIKRSRQ